MKQGFPDLNPFQCEFPEDARIPITYENSSHEMVSLFLFYNGNNTDTLKLKVILDFRFEKDEKETNKPEVKPRQSAQWITWISGQ